ncbi:hypothetical protein HA402_008742 [Bradysia odoriphaga]|nr:hypothetical protein HA402_008742 [Bradysia odoriphaga]
MANDIKLLELKPNQKLLDATFDGYKLSLEPISKLKIPLTIPPHKIYPSEEQYSSLHAQLFGLQNHLVRDPWSTNTTYFADANRNIQCIKYNEQIGKLDPLSIVYKLRQGDSSANDYNISFVFVSEKYCLLTDGLGLIHVIDTGDRFNKTEWKSAHSEIGLDGSHRFYIEDARFEIANETKFIYCILLHVEYVENSFETFLNLVQLKQELNSTWAKTTLKEIRLKNLPTYCSLEPRSSAIVLCTDRAVNLGGDTDETQKSQQNPAPEEKSIPFTWTQLDDDIFIKFNLTTVQQKCDFKVTSKDQWINVTYQNESLLEGKLFGEIDSDLTTWSMESERTGAGAPYIQVTLVKKDSSNSVWTSLLADQVISDKNDDEAAVAHKYGLTSVLQSEMEDCDMDINELDNDYNLLRIDTTTFTVTHKLNLGSNRPLFALNQRPGALPAIVIRSDVDALIWAPKFSPTNPSDWSLSHEATLNAFGYVQASKQQKKYIQCSPNADYAIICEPHRHVFIYKMNNSSALGLKKRGGGKVTIGQQKLFSMEEQDEILGMVVENEITILLTEKYIFVLQINA